MRWPYANIGVVTTRTFRNLLNKIHGDIAADMQEMKTNLDNAVETVSEKAFNKVVDAAKIDWLPPVNTFDDLAITYPDAVEGKTAMCRDSGKVYRKMADGEWQEIQDIDPSVINEVDSRLTAQLAETADKINVSKVDNLLNFIDAESDMEIEVPSYYKTKINEIVKSIDKSELNIGFITDNHNQYSGYAPKSLKHYEYIALLSRLTHLDAVVSGGDNANGWYSKSQILSELKSAASALFNRVKADTDVYFLHGNHDNGAFQNGKNKLEDIITNEELKVIYQTRNTVFGEVRNGDSIYCYKDYADKKIRVIMLNSFDFPNDINSDGTLTYDNLHYGCYQNEQLNWLANVALQIPLDYHALIFTHAPLPGAFDNSTQYNSDVLLNILKAFKNGQDYTIDDKSRLFPVSINTSFSEPGTLIAIINGHLHRDDSTIYNGILCISVDASLCYSGATGRVVNTETEDCWDVLSINPNLRTIRAKRFGFGSDRNWTY
ncbi:metallophosphoesterase [Weizmannia coagulans]|uniref:Calcineurin-like phosphoesterase domain-containing protein n=2 Tax=Heyndrickxia TaxID=2837504 RepID=A0AAN0T501_HEYCO|nr:MULTISPECIES: metallophosphoesterase [Heyndrickxia]AJO22892.1 Hypothetical protein SB48_HM08orf03319 [Heyndrickxia coagulans]AKN55597.1 Minor capsid protein [Heyndrickxia coagulans]ATW83130.1 hypothetical protein CIW84_09125 [Heyndrickxia coagulans]AVD56206.1 hypothetical protein C3766_08710 [Heyndrickxia coagulans]MBT2193776.1 metallophosphoesterase [Heyndrickxia coagulans]